MIRTNADTLDILDGLFPSEKTRWDTFFSKLKAEHPLSSMLPDEALAHYIQSWKILPCHALDLGCGNGRDAIFMAKSGFKVDAIDLSATVLKKAKSEAKKQKVDVRFIASSVFDVDFKKRQYGFVYDSGLLHHLFPHRRPQYLELVSSLLKKGGHFGLVAFNPKGGTNISDEEIYQQKTMGGGISFTRKKLEHLLGDRFTCVEFRPMKNMKPSDNLFGYDFLSTSLWKKK